MSIRKFRSTALMAGATLLFGIGGAYAATTTVQATIKFLTDIQIAPGTAANFGDVASSSAGVYVLDTANHVTATSGTVEGGTPATADFTLTQSTTGHVWIYATYGAQVGKTTLSAAVCSFEGGSATTCDTAAHELGAVSATGTSDLKVGLTATVAAGSTDGETDQPSYTLNVVYQ